jgi:putative membrane protein
MTTPSSTPPSEKRQAGAPAVTQGSATDLAQLRTIMASDRTLMAWTRTALAQLSFSFTIYKVLEGLQEKGRGAVHPHAPQAAGLFLAGMGVLSMMLGGVQYALTTRQLLKIGTFPLFFRAPAIMGMLMFLIGVVLFFGIATRMF